MQEEVCVRTMRGLVLCFHHQRCCAMLLLKLPSCSVEHAVNAVQGYDDKYDSCAAVLRVVDAQQERNVAWPHERAATLTTML